MNRLNSMSVRNQIIVLIVLMTLVPMAIIVYTALKQERHDVDEALDMTNSTAKQIHNDQKVLLAGAEQLAATVSVLPIVKQRDAASVNSLLAELVDANSQIANIIIVDRTGALWASAIPSTGGLYFGDRRYFREALVTGKISSGEYDIGKILQSPLFSFGFPIKDRSGDVSDVIGIVFTLDRYSQLYSTEYASPVSSILLADHKGTILYSSVDSTLTGKQDRPDLFNRMFSGPNEGKFEAAGNLGIRRVFSYKKLWLEGETTPYMYIRTGLNKDYVQTKARRDLMFGIGSLLPSMLIMLGMAIWFCNRYVLNRIRVLQDVTQRIALGDLTVRIPEHISGGELGELGAAFNDMAQRLQQTERILRQSEEKFSSTFHASPDAITLTRLSDGTYLEVNEGFTAIAGYLPEEVIGKSSTDLGIWDNAQDRDRLMQALHKNGMVKNMEFGLRRRDGVLRTGQISLRCIEINGEQCLLGITRDVTEHESLQNELIKAQRLESISVLAGGIAHNFNNVLTGVIGYISYAKKHLGDPGKVLQILESAENASHRAAGLARQLLTFSQGSIPVRKPVLVGTLVEESVSLFLSGSNVKGTIACASHQTIHADSQQISQAFNNIVLNALHAMPDGGTLAVRVDDLTLDENNRFSLHPGRYVKIVFEDSGCGIGKDDLIKVYDPYFTTKDSGTGLGLSTTHSIISKHGGHIDIASEVGKGTVVSILLPSTAEMLVDDGAAAEQAGIHPAEASILVMDDEAAIRDLAEELLAALGYTVTTCANGEEAYALYREARDAGKAFSIVILDLSVPNGMGGVEAAQLILGLDPQACLIASSGYSHDQALAEYEKFGFCGSIAKPYSTDELVREITRAFRNRPA